MFIENAGLIFLGLAGLFFGGNWLVRGASNLSASFGVSSLIIGLTIVAVGTSMPELFVSVQAALRGSNELSIGNIIGSNIANIGLILGLTGIVAPIAVKAIMVRREIPIMILFSIFTILLTLDGEINQLDGILLLFSFVGFSSMFYFLAKREQDEHNRLLAEMEEPPAPAEINRMVEIGFLALGIVTLVLGSSFMVEGATAIARLMGVSELLIGVTIVAVGTSLPELAASLTAAMKGENDIAIGNVVGSNIANLLLILGATTAIKPIPIETSQIEVELLVMLGFAFLLVPFAWNQKLDRRASAIFLGAYLAFVVYSVINARP